MLHDVIQMTTNFQSGYPNEGYHLYEFDLAEDRIRVTNDEKAYEEHKHFMKNRKWFEDRLKTVSPEHEKFEKAYQARLATAVRKPSTLKIDEFLEKINFFCTAMISVTDGNSKSCWKILWTITISVFRH